MEGCVGWDCVKRLIKTQKTEIHVPVFEQVYRGTAGKEQDSIIGFYNKVYMAAMKSIILQFAPNKVSEVASFSLVSYFYSLNCCGSCFSSLKMASAFLRGIFQIQKYTV